MGKIRQIEDGYTSPGSIETMYRIGRNAYFEVELALAERGNTDFDSNVNSSSLTNITAQGYEGDGGILGCPDFKDFVWIKDIHGEIYPIRAQSLLFPQDRYLYNPVTGHFNRLKFSKRLTATTFKVTTQNGVESIISDTHKIILDPSDLIGTGLNLMKVGDEVLTFRIDKGITLRLDKIISIDRIGVSSVILIELDDEFIYASGSNAQMGIVAHNRKSEPI